MQAEEKGAAKKRRLSACLVAAALTATIVPTWALSQGLTSVSVDDVQSADEIAVVDNDTTEEAPRTSLISGAIAGVPGSGAEGAKDPSFKKSHGDLKASYNRHSWDGAQITTTHMDVEDATPLPDDGRLEGGVCLIDADKTFDGRIVVNADTDLVLGDDCTLTANDGIHVRQGATLTICVQDGKGNGRLVANAKTGAGIGAYSGNKGGDVVICGGDVQATGGKNCAGIGSNDGDRTEVGSFTIFDGTVDATGGESGAGIGGGRASAGGSISIHGGTVTAQGGKNGAGIGCGKGDDSDGGTITIDGGTVNAYAGSFGAGIGGGHDSKCETIDISCGDVHAFAGKTAAGKTCDNGAGIGGGSDADGGTINISGGTVEAVGSNDGAGIGGGDHGDGGTITISGGDVTATGSNGAGIGGGQHGGNGGTITISGGTVTTTGSNGAGIGGGKGALGGLTKSSEESGHGGTITISGGTVNSISLKAFGIGSGGTDKGMLSGFRCGSAGKITISDKANVTTQGNGAGMGGDGGTIIIEDGTVTTSGIEGGKGAGFYFFGKTQDIQIRGGHVTATGYDGHPGIGLENGGSVEISGGEVHATGNGRPGIGDWDDGELKGTLTVKGKETQVFVDANGSYALGGHKKTCVDVHLEDGAKLIADGHGDHKALNVDSLELYPDAKVTAGRSKTTLSDSPYDARIPSACEANTYVSIEPCTHEKLVYEAIDGERHTCTCLHCGKNHEEAHTYGDAQGCTKCGNTDTAPTLDHIEAISDGVFGMRFCVRMPQDPRLTQGHMEFAISDKDGTTIEVPYDWRHAVRSGFHYFDCPLSSIQAGDVVTATWCYQDQRAFVAKTAMYEWVRDVDQHAGDYDEKQLSLVHALADYGHYTQEFLATEKGWKLDDDHARMPAATAYTATTVEDARVGLNRYAAPRVDKGDTVSRVPISVISGAETTLQVGFETDEELSLAMIDGQKAPEDSVKRVGKKWLVTISGIRADQLADGHEIQITTRGKGKTTTYIDGISPLTYAHALLESPSYAKNTKAQYAMASLYNYYLAASEA